MKGRSEDAELGWAEIEASMLYTSIRATYLERTRALPGDELIPEAIGSLNHAITIRRAPLQVWPWLVQMGAGRAGWYSYDFLDNGGQRSAEQVLPQFQNIEVGSVLPALPGVTDGFTVLQYEPQCFLVLGWQLPNGNNAMTWAFVLNEVEHGWTRLIVRARAGPDYSFHGLPWWIAKRIVSVVHFIMQRKQLLGIARRAERSVGVHAAPK